ncbi:hypothetical protein P7K49_016262 [Saguinus oedipus]|uniref:Ig-like domain-containing protein n=1 Tax=Saguinus oedipus TaxID=9490 RepID=A0ABQ9VDJ6_SAGOE|nr:hypothetical protein P7K49_016262 [Saguinus oedipus]
MLFASSIENQVMPSPQVEELSPALKTPSALVNSSAPGEARPVGRTSKKAGELGPGRHPPSQVPTGPSGCILIMYGNAAPGRVLTAQGVLGTYDSVRYESDLEPTEVTRTTCWVTDACQTGLAGVDDWCVSVVRLSCLSLTLKSELSLGQREVTVQKGPLFRAEGYPVSIGCNVTGHQGPHEQHFQWSVYLPTNPTQEVQIISTKDTGFSYAVYMQRVQSGDIYVERVQGNSVLLHISKIQVKDAGEYECHTPNTDEKYYGSYSAKTRLIVIPDTLSATMSSQTLNKEEGESLTLTCEASKATAQHTHLSVTWYLMQDGGGSQATEIISLSKDFILVPGPSYTERFAASDVRLNKLGASTFRMSIERLQPSDQGQLFCEVTEWIQDPNETWMSITKKQTDRTTLRIQPAVKDFQVNITADSLFAEGKPLELVCLVVGSGRDPQLQGIWFFNGTEIAHIDAGGVLGLKNDYKGRTSQGELQVSKLGPKTFSLKIFSLGPEDEGAYRCVVAEVMRTRTGSWQVLQRKQSPDSHVRLKKPAVKYYLKY